MDTSSSDEEITNASVKLISLISSRKLPGTAICGPIFRNVPRISFSSDLFNLSESFNDGEKKRSSTISILDVSCWHNFFRMKYANLPKVPGNSE